MVCLSKRLTEAAKKVADLQRQLQQAQAERDDYKAGQQRALGWLLDTQAERDAAIGGLNEAWAQAAVLTERLMSVLGKRVGEPIWGADVTKVTQLMGVDISERVRELLAAIERAEAAEALGEGLYLLGQVWVNQRDAAEEKLAEQRALAEARLSRGLWAWGTIHAVLEKGTLVRNAIQITPAEAPRAEQSGQEEAPDA